MKRILLSALALAVAVPAAPALADPPHWAPAHGKRAKHYKKHYPKRWRGTRHTVYRPTRYYSYAPRGYHVFYPERHYRSGRYYRPYYLSGRDRVYRGYDDRYYCRRSDGTTGLIVGAAIGALVGRDLDRGDSRALGTVLGAAGGALIGRELDRGVRCY